jgi:drug efflux transport system ATP-binding protein
MPLVEIKNVSKNFAKGKQVALKNISCEFPTGSLIAIAGPDGAGKTTLMRLLSALLKPDNGTVLIDNKDSIKQAKQIHEIISYMPQKFGLYEDLSVIQNLDLYSELQGLEKHEKPPIFEKLLEFTSLKNFQNRLAGKLSGGMKQKLGLACTLLRKPKLLVLDEPTVGVDPISRRELWKMIYTLKKDNITVVFSTAYLDEAERADNVLLINEGSILYFGKPVDLLSSLENRVYLIKNITTDRRQVLKVAAKDNTIIDTVIQGNSIRIVLQRNISSFDLKKLNPGENAILEKVAPRFEDAFFDIMTANDKKVSPLNDLLTPLKKSETPLVEAKNLTKKFDHFIAADDISFTVSSGEVFGLLGPNGAGKSTTFKMLCGLLKPTYGSAHVANLSLLNAPSQARKKIGYMAQKFSLYGNMTAFQNLRFFSGIYSVKNPKKAINKMIEIFSLYEYVNMIASKLPLGFKQRLALACAIMHQPEVIFLDEPTSGVDPSTRREFWGHINAMVEKGASVVITTHFMDEAEYCDRIGLVNQGKLIRIGTPDALKEEVKSENFKSPSLEDAFIELSKKENEN